MSSMNGSLVPPPNELEKELWWVLREMLWVHQCPTHKPCSTCTLAWETIDRYDRERNDGRCFLGGKLP
jgi:hypothetical protein